MVKKPRKPSKKKETGDEEEPWQAPIERPKRGAPIPVLQAWLAWYAKDEVYNALSKVNKKTYKRVRNSVNNRNRYEREIAKFGELFRLKVAASSRVSTPVDM